MKKRIVLFTLFIGLGYFLLSSYSHGASTSGFICCGAKSSVTNCAGSSCHGSGSGTDASISVTGPGGFTGSYVPGANYTITISGNNNLFLPKYGFQFAAVTGSGATEVQAGTFTSYPSYVTGNYISGITFVEQTQGIDAPTPGTYTKSFQWKAPSTPGLSFVKMYLTLLAVNGNNVADTLDVSRNVSITLAEEHASSVQNLGNTLQINTWPNPAGNTLNITTGSREPGICSITAYDLNGRLATTETIADQRQIITINTSAWLPGLYNVVVQKDGNTGTTTIVKQ